MSIESIIRAIVREELERVLRPKPLPPPTPIYNPPGSGLTELDDDDDDWPYSEDTTPIVPRRERTGCACPPGTVASCPQTSCPWKS